MPEGKVPDSFKNLAPDIKAKAISVFNAILRDSPDTDEGVAIATAIKRARSSSKTTETVGILQRWIDTGDLSDIKSIEGIDTSLLDTEGIREALSMLVTLIGESMEEEKVQDETKDETSIVEAKATKKCSDCDKEVPEDEMDEHKEGHSDEGKAGKKEDDSGDKKKELPPWLKKKGAAKEDIEPVGDVLSDKRIQEDSGHILEASGNKGTEWEVVLIAPGISKNRTFYSDETLLKAQNLFEGVSCFADHSASDQSRSVKDVVGWYDNVKFREGYGVTATFHALESTPWFLGPFKEAYERGKQDLIGFSINGEGTRRMGKHNGSLAYFVESIDRIDSVDAVISPSAGGKVVRLVASEQEEELQMLDNLSLDELKAARPDLVEALTKETKEEKEEVKETTDIQEETKKEEDTENTTMREQEKDNEMSEKLQEEIESLKEDYKRLQEEAAIARTQARVQEMLSTSPLPKAVHAKIAKKFDGKSATKEEIQEEIDGQKEVISALFDERPQSIYHDINGGMGTMEKAQKALDGLLQGKAIDGVRPARGLKEAYALYKGTQGLISSWDVNPFDVLRESLGGYNSWSRFKEGTSELLESATAGSQAYGAGGTPTWAELLGDSITRKMLKDYAEIGYDEWRQVCSSIIPINDFRTQRRMRLGGYDAVLSSVAEAASYSGLTTPADEEATYFVKKYGNTDDVTLEVIANDDVGAVRQLPTKLARVAKISLFIFVFNLIEKSSAPTATYDSVALYGSAHANSASAALSDAALSTAKTSMRTKTVYNVTSTGKDYLGMRNKPKFLLVPTALEPTAQRLLQNEFTFSGPATPSGGSYSQSDINVHRGTLTPIVVDYWTTSSWYLLGDPAMANTIEMGFFQGREEPELFTQDNPLLGSVFTNDKITYKIRHIYGGTVLDHRAFYAGVQA